MNTSGPAEWRDIKEAEIGSSRNITNGLKSVEINPVNQDEWRRLMAATKGTDNEVAQELCNIGIDNFLEEGRYVFCKEKNAYRIVFNFEELPRLPSSKGLNRIHYLIEDQNKYVSSLTLCQTESPFSEGKEQTLENEESSEEISYIIQNRFTSNYRHELLDDIARGKYGNRLKSIKKKLEDAEELGNDVEVATLKDERVQILQELTRNGKFKCKPRNFQSPEELARVAVRKSILTAISKFQHVSPPLFTHFRESFKFGGSVIYCPKLPIKWITR